MIANLNKKEKNMASIKNDALTVGTVGLGAAAVSVASQTSVGKNTARVVVKPLKAMVSKDTYIATGEIIKKIAKGSVSKQTYARILEALKNTGKKAISKETYSNVAKAIADKAQALYKATLDKNTYKGIYNSVKENIKKAGTKAYEGTKTFFKTTDWKKAGKIGLAAAALAGVVIGVKALYDGYANKD